jgi:small-conductance mechanosensitive channel
MQQWATWLNQEFWLDVSIVLIATLVFHLALRAAIGLLRRHFEARAQAESHNSSRWPGLLARLLARTSGPLLLAFSLLLALKLVDLPPAWENALQHGWFIALALQVALWLDAGVRLWTTGLLQKKDAKQLNPVTTTIISILVLILIWAIMLLSILANLGVNITAMVASLGVGGIAVALAVQTLLSDMFASLSIGIDKPFEIGDFVVFGDIAGSIEHIGLKTTRIRSLSGEQVVCANADLLSQTLHNYKRMDTRRIVFSFGIAYDTPADKVREVSALVRRIIEGIERTRFDRAHFLSFGESQLNFEVVYIVLSSDYNVYMDIQQEINLGLLQGLRELKVRFALPIRKVEFMGGSLPEVRMAQIGGAAADSHAAQPQNGPRLA